MRLKVTHSSLYRYQPAVETAQHFLHLKPRLVPCQRLESHHLSISPEPTELFESQDFYQNPTHYLALLNHHEQLSITSESVLSTWAFGEQQSPPSQMNFRFEQSSDFSIQSSQMQAQWPSSLAGQALLGEQRAPHPLQLNAWTEPAAGTWLSNGPSMPVASNTGAARPSPSLIELWQEAWAVKAREHYEYNAGKQFDEASDFLFDSPHIPRLEVFSQYAQRCLSAPTPLLKGLTALMNLIHEEFTYESKSTQVNTPLTDIFASRKGVCQDFAHIMVACCRSFGLAARYVSGYLLTMPPAGQARLIGSDASHAWASVYLPALNSSESDTGLWFDFDPTNNRCGIFSPGQDYITTAWGRDYSDVSPVRGVIQGGNDHLLDVAVTVLPLD